MIFDEELNGYIKSKQREINKQIAKIEDFNCRDEYFKVKRYLDEYLEGALEKRFIVLPGLRGVGKSTIVYQLMDYLINTKNVNQKNVLYLTMDGLTSYFQTDLLHTVDIFLEKTHKVDKINLDEKIFVFVDECHFDKKWAISGKIIYDINPNIFFLFTGSSALDLEINTDVARRMFKEQIFPNNFKDYLLLKHNISFNCKFPKELKNMIHFGNKKFINRAIDCEEIIHEKLSCLNNDPKIEFEKFLKSYSFPSTLNLDEEEAYFQINTIINNIIEKDIFSVKSFNTSTTDVIRRIILYIALQKPGTTSHQKIANYLSISPTTVREILETLEKTQLIFNLKPYGGGGKILKKAWQYYFLSPSLKAAINFEIGRYDLDSKECLGILAENLVASALYKMTKVDFKYMGLFYPPDKGSSDFIIRTKFDDSIPIEVGIGKKTKSQLIKDINKYNSKYGILVSNRYEQITHINNIIYIPLMSFSFI
ncbi:hypothetical protein MBCUT_08330 [Methanobrevibacter cuticularis]|uniref:AAA domain-containing protein n=1 Tax=Methanobrevibacter cuticularis TaxID=47311 RepID=A0A166CSF6_9EURY|nr:AAA family ATPase [Methanobrevibacter cuticularis]KZX16447.1 hypothetical protein MBCUT_08330 [Methanobrevibacter cuticularis]